MELLSADLSTEEMAAWRPFVMAATLVLGALDADMKAGFGISHFDHALLVFLSTMPMRRARMGDVARAMALDPSNITHRVRRLEARGLVERQPDSEDGRVIYARLTVAGMLLLREAWPMHRDGIRRHFLNHVRPEQLPAIAEVFDSITASQSPPLESGR